MKKINIIKKNKDFNRIIRKRNGVSTKFFIINNEKNSDNLTKFGITYNKHYGNAVERNKIKRRIKSIIDNNENSYTKSYNYIIIAKQNAKEVNYNSLEKDLINAFNKINKKGETNEKE